MGIFKPKYWIGNIHTHGVKMAHQIRQGFPTVYPESKESKNLTAFAQMWEHYAQLAEAAGKTLIVFEIPAEGQMETISAIERFLNERPETKKDEKI